MPALILALFIAVPLAEIAVFIKVGEFLGIGWTVALVIITAMAGTALLRSQGFSVLARAQSAIAEGRVPVDSVIDGVCLLIAGAFLLTPGLITDTIGFLLFIPPLRQGLARWLFNRMVQKAEIHVTHPGRRPPGDAPGPHTGPTIEADFEPVKEPPESKPRGRRRPSPWREPR